MATPRRHGRRRPHGHVATPPGLMTTRTGTVTVPRNHMLRTHQG
ncbi:hypothetical protein SSCG_03006 [Streptomyces clavuligerus]|nr:hypothetical protein SSCG_03006 [Streptomyces clavuligerus]